MHVNAMVNPDDETMDHFMRQGVIDKERLTVRSVKIYADGALGSRGAKLLEPYTDDPTNDGLILESDEFYRHVCQKAYDAGYQVCCHAIGDGGVHHILDIFSEYLKGKNDLRWRIEHSQTVADADFQRFGEFSVIPSIKTHTLTNNCYSKTVGSSTAPTSPSRTSARFIPSMPLSLVSTWTARLPRVSKWRTPSLANKPCVPSRYGWPRVASLKVAKAASKSAKTLIS